jgi:hypothetical protein
VGQDRPWAAVGPRDVEHRVDGFACLVFTVGPEVRVRVEGLGGGGVPESRLHDFDRLAVSDEQRGVVVAERVEAGAGWRVGCVHGLAPWVGKTSAADRLASLVGEDELVVFRREPFQVPGERVGDRLRERDRPDAGVGLGRRKERRPVLDEHELLYDVEPPAEEVDVRDGDVSRRHPIRRVAV